VRLVVGVVAVDGENPDIGAGVVDELMPLCPSPISGGKVRESPSASRYLGSPTRTEHSPRRRWKNSSHFVCQ
jgi:hypothetical protein